MSDRGAVVNDYGAQARKLSSDLPRQTTEICNAAINLFQQLMKPNQRI